ncbi:MAG: NAD regulator, partial [Pseudorhodoplanes sp.]
MKGIRSGSTSSKHVLTPIEIGLTTAIVAVTDDEPQVLVAGETGQTHMPDGLPSGPFDPLSHRTFEIGLREWVAAQTALDIVYVEQLYTFGDRGRHARADDTSPHVVSIGYLALTRVPENVAGLREAGAGFRPWYRFFPWEDWRNGRPAIIDDAILPPLTKWARGAAGRAERLRLCFGDGGTSWDEEKVLERYELLYSAGLIEEAQRDGRVKSLDAKLGKTRLGESMRLDHRRILATAIARLRGKLKYRPVVFELMPSEFTLTELQRTVEAISGRHLHKQNFRRLVESTELVEPTGEMATATGG